MAPRTGGLLVTAPPAVVRDPATYERRRALPATEIVDVDGTPVRVHDAGDGPTIVLVNGFLANGDLWRGVVPDLVAAGYRCVVPDWPLGGHTVPVPRADLSPAGLTELLGRLLETLALEDVTVVANDSGGLAVQGLLVGHHPRVARAVLTPVDCYAHFPPPTLRLLPVLARSARATWCGLQALRLRPVRRLPFAFGRATRRAGPDDVMAGFLTPGRDSPAIRADVRRFLRQVAPRHTLATSRGFGSVRAPVLVVWGSDDRMFPIELARRLVEDLPDARLEVVDDAAAWLPEDQPRTLAALIDRFVGRSVGARR